MEATEIFVSLPTADDRHKKATLQDAIALLVCTSKVLDCAALSVSAPYRRSAMSVRKASHLAVLRGGR
jgi:hypothetical protein